VALDEQDPCEPVMEGKISLFLAATKFRVQLNDGRIVDAVLPDHLLAKIVPYYSGPPIVERICVTVEFRDPPAMHRIVDISGGDGWCGVRRGAWR
jgi:hypothetical protein